MSVLEARIFAVVLFVVGLVVAAVTPPGTVSMIGAAFVAAGIAAPAWFARKREKQASRGRTTDAGA